MLIYDDAVGLDKEIMDLNKKVDRLQKLMIILLCSCVPFAFLLGCLITFIVTCLINRKKKKNKRKFKYKKMTKNKENKEPDEIMLMENASEEN